MRDNKSHKGVGGTDTRGAYASYSRDRVGGMRYNDHLAKRRRVKCRLRRERAKLRRQGE